MREKTERNSVFELLRLVSMFIIVFYHLLMNILYSLPDIGTHSFALLESFLPTIHIGVILFILISGYFGIKPSVKGCFFLLAITAVYYITPYLLSDIIHHRICLYRFLFISHTPYWFIKTYVYLYLTSPLINAGWKALNSKQHIYIVVALAIISMWFGLNKDSSLVGGKNLTNFTFIYLLGRLLQETESKWKQIKPAYLAIVWLIINTALVIVLNVFNTQTTIGNIVYNLSFPYNSPILIINSCLIFCLFAHLHFHSKIVNSLAISTLPVYLIHGHPYFTAYCMLPMCEYAICLQGGGIRSPFARHNSGYYDRLHRYR